MGEVDTDLRASNLSDRLRAAVDRGLEASRELGALIEADPGEAAGWLIGSSAEAMTRIEQRKLQRLLGVALRRCRETGVPPSVVVGLLRSFTAIVPIDAAVDALEGIEPAVRVDASDVVDSLLDRAPRDPGLLRLGASTALQSGDAAAFHRRLNRLGQLDSSQATVHWVSKMRAELPDRTLEPVRVALLSSFTIDPLVPYLDGELRRLGLAPQVSVAPFNSWGQEIVNPESALRRFNAELAFLSVSIDDLLPKLGDALSEEELVDGGEEALQRLTDAATVFSGWSDGHLVVHGFHSCHRDPFGTAAGRGAPDRGAWIAGLNHRLAERLRELPRVHVIDVGDLLMRRPAGAYDNPKMRLLASMRLVGPALAEVAKAYSGYVAAACGLTRKCVVVDLDNTLWGGIVGEDGPNGIRLGDTAPGAEYQEFQRYLLSLTRRGILLAVNSKNNPEDALEVIRSHPGMLIRETSISASQINWLPKPENMLAIAEELNIGVDSLVFVDDNPNERELMRQMLPDVLTPEMPADPALYRTTLESLPQLQSLVVTEVDRARVQQYRAKRIREGLKTEAGSLESYLASLEISVVIGQADESSLQRVHQLFQRTNQFNLTTRRHDAGVLEAYANASDWRLYTLRASDRFGDHGLAATALVNTGAGEWTIDSFLMSCRVISYGIETALLHAIVEDARAAGAGALVGEYIETPKNAPARDLYPSHGFVHDGGSGAVDRWELDLGAGDIAAPAWVSLELMGS